MREVGAGEPELPAAEAFEGVGGHGDGADGGGGGDVEDHPRHCLLEFLSFWSIFHGFWREKFECLGDEEEKGCFML